MKNKEIKKFVKERNAMLNKFSVQELEKFIVEHSEYYDKNITQEFMAKDEKLKMATLCISCLIVNGIYPKVTEKAIQWLEKNMPTAQVLQDTFGK